MTYLQALISAELRPQGLNILDHLINKRLAFGGPVFNGPAKFLWKNEVVFHDYCFIVTYTREDLKAELIREAEAASVEEVCMISFIPFEGNPALVRLLDSVFAERDTAPRPKPKDAIASLKFMPTEEIPSRTKSSFGSPSSADDGTDGHAPT